MDSQLKHIRFNITHVTLNKILLYSLPENENVDDIFQNKTMKNS